MKTKISSLVVLLCIFASCSSDNPLKETDAVNKINMQKENLKSSETYKNHSMSTSVTVLEFLNEKYDGLTEITDTLTIEVDGEGIQKLFKVSVVGNNFKDIYLSANPETLEMIYFAEFNWQTETLESVNFEYGDVETFTVTQEESAFYLIRDNTLIEITDPAIPEVEANRFWGWDCGKINSWPDGTETRTCCYKVIWRDILPCRVVNVGFEPGSNPKIEPGYY